MELTSLWGRLRDVLITELLVGMNLKVLQLQLKVRTYREVVG